MGLRVIFSFLFFFNLVPMGITRAQDMNLVRAVDLLVEEDSAESIQALKALLDESASEENFYILGNAYSNEKKWEEAAGIFRAGCEKHPLSARLHNGAALALEKQFKIQEAIGFYRRTTALDAQIVYTGGGRYDPDFDAIYIPVVHDHRGANSCSGRLYITDKAMHYVVYIVASGFGKGNDDSFVIDWDSIEYVEVDKKKGEQMNDYSIITLLTNLSGPRRRMSSNEDTRIDLKFVFKGRIEGYRGKSWSKKDIKFFFIEPEVGAQFLAFLESQGVRTQMRN